MDERGLRDLGQRYTAAWCSQNAARVAAFFADTGSLTINEGEPAVGRRAITDAAQRFMTAFPDMVVAMDGVAATGGHAKYGWTLRGTNTGPGGTGQAVSISGYEEWTFDAHGLIARSKGHFDEADYNQQLRRGDADEIVSLERAALERWGRGDPGGFLDVYAADVTYFDPLTAARLDGHGAMARYYEPWAGKIHVDRFDMQGTHVCIEGDMAVLTYNLVNYMRNQAGVESVGSRWNSTAVYRRRGGRWKSVHVHWSFTEHPAFQQVTVESAERQG